MVGERNSRTSERPVHVPAAVCAIGAPLPGCGTGMISGALLEGPLGTAGGAFLVPGSSAIGALAAGNSAARAGGRRMGPTSHNRVEEADPVPRRARRPQELARDEIKNAQRQGEAWRARRAAAVRPDQPDPLRPGAAAANACC